MSEILSNIYVWVFWWNSKNVLVLAFGKYKLYSRSNQSRNQSRNFGLLEAKTPCLWRKIVQNFLYFCIYFIQKQHNWFYKNFHKL